MALAYVCMNKEDPLTVAAECTAAYHATNPLIEAEVDLIWVMMGGRSVQVSFVADLSIAGMFY